MERQKGRRRKEPPLRRGLCVLQLGDSLTQGVGEYYSYREPLAPMLSDWWEATSLLSNTNNEEESEGPAIQYVGSQRYRCTPKLPSAPYIRDNSIKNKGNGDSSMLLLRHEGHCSWGSFAVRKALEEQYDNTSNAFITMAMAAAAQPHQTNEQQEQQQQEKREDPKKRVETSGNVNPVLSSSENSESRSNRDENNSENSNEKGDGDNSISLLPPSTMHYPCRPNVVLALMGHNDAFQIARLCKLREDQQGSVESVRRADMKIQWRQSHQENKWKAEEKEKADEGSRSMALFDQLVADGDDLESSGNNGRRIFEKGSNNNKLKEKNIVCVAKHLSADNAFRSNVRAILTRVTTVTPMVANRVVVLWGLNPPTGFPAIDIMLRVVLLEERERLLGQLQPKARSLQVDPPREGKTEIFGDTFPIIDFVSFEGFTPGVHTFDSTHPNGKGSELMARAWLTGLKRAHNSVLSRLTTNESNGNNTTFHHFVPPIDRGGRGKGEKRESEGGDGTGPKVVVKVNAKAEARQRAEEAEARRLYLEQFGDGKAAQGNTGGNSLIAVGVGGVGFSASVLVVALAALLLLFAFRRRLTFFARRTRVV